MKKSKLVFLTACLLTVIMMMFAIGCQKKVKLDENKISDLFQNDKNYALRLFGKGEYRTNENDFYYKSSGISLHFDDFGNLLAIVPFPYNVFGPTGPGSFKLYNVFGVSKNMSLQQIENLFGADKLEEQILEGKEGIWPITYIAFYQRRNFVLEFRFNGSILFDMACISSLSEVPPLY